MRFLGFLALLTAASAAVAGEYAVLTTGARLRADRHETEGGRVRLYSGEGYVEMDASRIQAFEAVEDPAPAAVPAPVAVAETPKPAPTPTELADAAAIKYGLPPSLVRSVMSAESAGRQGAVSPKGAIGLMQVMPQTAERFGKVNLFDAEQNIRTGTRYLHMLQQLFRHQLDLVLAAYNAGEQVVARLRRVPPYPETEAYVSAVTKLYEQYRGRAQADR